MKVCTVTAILYLRVQMEFSLYFLQFSFNLDKTDTEDSPKNFIEWLFVENQYTLLLSLGIVN
jgi:hypothetical protein